MKYTALLAALAALLIANQSANAQGALTPPGAPAESQKSLQEIYDAIQVAKAEFATLVQQAVPSVPGMVAVLGGALPAESELAGEKVSTFYIAKYEVTWGEWQKVRDWAVNHGYTDLITAGAGSEEQHPVHGVSWYEAVQWCNAKSEMDNLTPVYTINGTIYKTGQLIPNFNLMANGYRLPTELEWEWSARGGVASEGFVYSGSDDPNEVAWYAENSVDGTKPVGSKKPNELEIYDMSGNVWEWCWDEAYNHFDVLGRAARGGSYIWNASDIIVSRRDADLPEDNITRDNGFRYSRRY